MNYEDTVADLEGVAKYLLEACGLDYEPGCLEFHRTQRRVKTASLGQVRQPDLFAVRWPLEELRVGARLTCFRPSRGTISRFKHSNYGTDHRQCMMSQSDRAESALARSADQFRSNRSPGGRRKEASASSRKPGGVTPMPVAISPPANRSGPCRDADRGAGKSNPAFDHGDLVQLITCVDEYTASRSSWPLTFKTATPPRP